MRKLTLKRIMSDKNGTFGRMTLPSGLTLYTAELPWKDNRKEISAIPEGEYLIKDREATAKFSYPHYGVFELDGSEVRGRTACLIHSGNHAGDTELGLKSDTQGCILIGTRMSVINSQRGVAESKKALGILREEMGTDDFILNII